MLSICFEPLLCISYFDACISCTENFLRKLAVLLSDTLERLNKNWKFFCSLRHTIIFYCIIRRADVSRPYALGGSKMLHISCTSSNITAACRKLYWLPVTA